VVVPSYQKRIEWFHQARFGLFIHWGLYSLLGRGEWVMFQERMSPQEYAKLADQFVPKKFDADAWAGLAVEAGMKYAVLTARHHDGYCLYDSAVSDFTSVKCAARRDFVADYVKACRKAGLKVGIYYSLLDWRFPGYFDPKKHPDSAEALKVQYREQVRELMTNYGKIDVLWYDGEWINHGMAGIDDKAGFWRSREVNAMVRKLQPHILINNRSGTDEDLDTPEQHVKASKPGRGWESCMTMGFFTGWGYTKHNALWKTPAQLLHALVSAASGEGNYLLNIGPKPDGTIRREEADRLKAMGAWLKLHGEAVYGSQRCDLHGGSGGKTTPTNNWSMIGTWTRRDNVGYLIIDRWPGTEAIIPLVQTRARSAKLLATGQKLKVRHEYNGRLVISGLPLTPPSADLNVIAVTFEGEPHRMAEANSAAWLTASAQ